MPEITGSSTGGAAITSYALYWNSGSGTTFTALVGVSSANTNRIFTQAVGSTGQYQFYYQVQNAYGWSPASPVTEITAANAPNAPDTPTVVVASD